MKISVITAVFNNRRHIEDCIESVLAQTYTDIEYIIIDGGSTDGTVDAIRKYENRVSKWTSEPDNGIYDALNKGLNMAAGDVVGFLHSDDVYAHDRVIERVASEMEARDVDSCYGDLLYVDKDDTRKVIRYWRAYPYNHGLFRRGWMPPHPTFFARREVYKRCGCFNTDFRIAADYELMLRLLEKCRISTVYIPEVLIRMRMGGVSNRSVTNMVRKSREDYRAWKMNNLDGGALAVILKNVSKIPQFFRKTK